MNSNNSKGPGLDMGINEMLDFYMMESQVKAREEGKEFQKMPLRPSAAGQCARALAFQLEEYWKLASYPKPFKEPNVMRLLNLGHSVEYALIRDLKTYLKEHFRVEYEQQSLLFFPLKSEANAERNHYITGNIDFTLSSATLKTVCDSKSKGNKWSSYRDSKWKEDDEKFAKMNSVQQLGKSAFYVEDIMAFLEEYGDPFMADNIIQINLYTCNQFMVELGFNYCSLFYYCKNDSMLREFRFKPSQQLADYVKTKFTDIFTKIDRGEGACAVEREFSLGSIKCAFCDYGKTCWPENDPLRDFFKTLPKKEWPIDVYKLERQEEIEELYQRYTASVEASEQLARIEEELCNLLVEEKARKVRFSDKEVFEVKLLKSPREHFELRRSKV